MVYETLLRYARELRLNWSHWNDLDRGAAVVRIRQAGVSLRKLALIAGCSEGLIRHIEIVGRLPTYWKQYLYAGHSTRKVVGWWRAERRRKAAIGIR
jgi:hypothetical protein